MATGARPAGVLRRVSVNGPVTDTAVHDTYTPCVGFTRETFKVRPESEGTEADRSVTGAELLNTAGCSADRTRKTKTAPVLGL